MIDLSDREIAIGVTVGAVAFVAGTWAGIWMLPAEALSVPTETQYSGTQTVTQAAYTPVPRFLPGLSILVVAGAVYYSWTRLASDDDPETAQDAEPATDGGIDGRR